MATRALLVEPRHRQATARWLHDVEAMRIVALDAVHLAFADRVVLRQIELSVNFQMTGETCLRIAAGIDDKLGPSTARRDVFAPRTVAGFAARTARHLRRIDVQPRVRAGGENARVVRMAIDTCGVANEMRSFDFRRGYDGTFDRGTGRQKND